MSIRVEHLKYAYPKAKEAIIKDISFEVPDGKVTVIIGANGVGKSTLIKTMLGIFRGEGEAWFDGRSRREMSHGELTTLVGYMTQENALLTSLSVLNVVLLGRLGTLNIRVQDEDIDKAMAMLRLLHLEPFIDRPFYALSGGQRRMVDVAQTLVRDPKILIMDEPTANLDLVNEMQVLELVKAYTHKRETATLLTLHDLNMAARYADNMILLKDGFADGFLSGYIHDNWKIGDTVETSGPQGTFYYEGIRDAEKVIAVAGGSGITPVFSMACAIADGDEDFDLTILYGSRTRDDVLFEDEFAEIMKKTDKVRVINVLSEEETEGCEHGFITADLIRKYGGEGTFSVFAAGSKGMYDFLDGEAQKLELKKKYYRKELYDNVSRPWEYEGYPMEAKDKTFNLKIKMCDKVFDVPCAANENIMVALERAGIAGPNRCRGGICGWCRSRLLEGTVFIPEETDGRRAKDKELGYIHPCASFATGDIYIEMPNRRN